MSFTYNNDAGEYISCCTSINCWDWNVLAESTFIFWMKFQYMKIKIIMEDDVVLYLESESKYLKL